MRITGRYAFRGGRLIPDEGMRTILAMMAGMELLRGTGVMPYYYRDSDGRFWRYLQHEDYLTEFEEVTRQYLEANEPGVDPGR